MSTFDTFERINEADLHFDRHNPRLVEFGLRTSSSDEEIVKILWDAMDVKEITQSIIASGYWENDPLIVSQENGKNVVIEGNRRLAAVKILRHPDKYSKLISSIPKIKDELSNQLEEIPALIQTRKESWKFLGFKHVNGPAKWGSYAKAKYVADVHNKYISGLKKSDSKSEIHIKQFRDYIMDLWLFNKLKMGRYLTVKML